MGLHDCRSLTVQNADSGASLWVQKGVVLLLLSRILASLPIAQRIIQVYWVVLVLTIAAVQVTTFIDCRPTYLYWQVEPDPGVLLDGSASASQFN